MNNQAQAWVDWRDSEGAQNLFDIRSLRAPTDMRQYLENRLWHAFMAGYRAAAAKPESNRNG